MNITSTEVILRKYKKKPSKDISSISKYGDYIY